MKHLPRRPSPAMIVALIALFVSLGGTGYAVVTITGKNVKNSSLTGRDIRNGSVRSPDVAGLRARDFRPGELPSGAQGPKGDKGDKGDPGDAARSGARAFALVDGDNCSGTPTQFCDIQRGKNVAYVVRIGEGRYCVGVSGINASAADSLAVVAPGIGTTGDMLSAVTWRSDNAGCVAAEFEVETTDEFSQAVRNAADNGTTDVAGQPHLTDDTFTITIP